MKIWIFGRFSFILIKREENVRIGRVSVGREGFIRG